MKLELKPSPPGTAPYIFRAREIQWGLEAPLVSLLLREHRFIWGGGVNTQHPQLFSSHPISSAHTPSPASGCPHQILTVAVTPSCPSLS